MSLSISRPGTEIRAIGSRVKIIEGKDVGKIGTLIKFHKVGWPGRFIGKKWVSDKELNEDTWTNNIDSSGKSVMVKLNDITKHEYRTRVGIKLDNGSIIWAWYWDCENER